eukprot:TRINITY_DN1077_c0_g1_i5.p1 TRINITY_DN1077_c0_g1~~TRINITY_DN1077_c0_g1_i5.p1  ORF type:complete len:299 (+),score=71.69 TRINITY_DN1077_c0_g1_i5:52-948(+)
MPRLLEANTGQRIVFLPKDAIDDKTESKVGDIKDEENELRILKLPHPGKESGALYLYNARAKKLFELMNFSEPNRAWFVGDRVVEDGSLILSTPINPVFIILPFLIKAERNVPLEDLLDSAEYPELHQIAGLSGGLTNVARQLGDPDLNVWKFDEDKCLTWLQARVNTVKDVLSTQDIDLSAGATSLLYKANVRPSQVEYTRYALGIVSEYLPVDLAGKLATRLNLPEPDKPLAKRLSEGAPGKQPPTKKAKHEGPTEDYSKDVKKEKNKESELNAKQKALAKSAEGTKNIMSFFKKK